MAKLIKKTLLAATAGYIAYEKTIDTLFDKTFKRKEFDVDVDENHDKWIKSSNVASVTITSFDGLKLNAYRVNNHDNNKYVIMLHGANAKKESLFEQAYEFDRMGFNLLLVDQRACGLSQGDFITYGFKESFDLAKWIDYLISKNPNVEIVLYGISMGAATIMELLGCKLPNNVRCAIEDSGFSSMKEEFAYTINNEFGIKYTDVILFLFENKITKELGFKYDDCNQKEMLKNNELPLLIIHSEDDDVVPYEMAKRVYNCNKGTKKFYRVKSAIHGKCHNEKNYYKNIKQFIDNYM